MMCYTVRKKECSSLFLYKAIIVWFSQFIMTVVQNLVTLSEKRRPGTGSSPKTAGSQSVNITPFYSKTLDASILFLLIVVLGPISGKTNWDPSST